MDIKVRSGYSLLELTIIILIVSVIAFFSVSQAKRLYQAHIVNNLQHEISSQVSLHKAHAYAKQSDLEVNFLDRFYEIYVDDRLIATKHLPNNFTVSPKRIGFKPDGVTKYAGTISLFYKGEKIAKFIVAPVTGLFRWEDL